MPTRKAIATVAFLAAATIAAAQGGEEPPKVGRKPPMLLRPGAPYTPTAKMVVLTPEAYTELSWHKRQHQKARANSGRLANRLEQKDQDCVTAIKKEKRKKNAAKLVAILAIAAAALK